MNVVIFLCCVLAVIFSSTENVFGEVENDAPGVIPMRVPSDAFEDIPAEAPVSANLSCPSYETECALGCCPYADAVCCSDGFECCQHGQTCIPYIGICIGLVNEKDKDLALMSSKATPVKNFRTPCPSGTTTCGPNRCCPFPDGVCCVDGEHCCPNGYRCDLSKQRCIRNSDNIYTTFSVPSTSGMKSFEPFKTVRKEPYKSCPGGAKQCPSDMSCCLNDENVWSCCPDPKSLQYKKKGINMCCMTMRGYVCCPAWAHACTYRGCI